MRRFILLSFAFVLFISSCNKNKNAVELFDTSLNGETIVTDNITFQFSDYLVPDSLLYNWDTTEYIKFNPHIPGAFKWTSNDALLFSPENKLAPATTFEARFTNNLLAHTEDVTSVNIEPISFSTSLLQLESSSLYWFKASENDASVARLELLFNHRVDADDIANNLSLEVEGEETSLVANSTESAFIHYFEMPSIEAIDKDYVVQISLENGIKPSLGKNGTEQKINLGKVLKSPFRLDVNEITSDHDGTNGMVTIVTSQAVSERNLKDFISVEPAVKFTITTNDNGFTIKSKDFALDSKYEIVIKKGLMGNVGGKLTADSKEDVAFGELEPDIYFENDKGFYLSGEGYKNIAVKIVNVDKVQVVVSKLYESNIMAANEYGSYRDYWYDGYSYYGTQLEDIIFSKTYETKKLKKVGGSHLLELDFEDELKDYPGIYHVHIESDEDYWLEDSRLISVSDIGLIVKKGQNEMMVFANSLLTAGVKTSVNLKLYGRNNQIIAEGVTGGDGVARLALKNKAFSGFTPSMLTASKGDDFTILNLDDTRTQTSRFEVGGYRGLPNGLQTFIYFERDLYRPGETVNLACVIRNQNWESPGNLPVKIEVKLPNGKVLKTLKKTLNSEGSFDVSFDTEANNVTGRYSVYVYSSTNVMLASKSVLIEEFMPDRIKVSTSFSNEDLSANSETDLLINAQNLFGTPAANRNYEVEVSYRRKYFSPEKFSNYNFNIANTDRYFDKDFREGETDDNGEAVETYIIPEEYENMGALRADVYTTVFDETGRPVNQKDELDIYTQEHFYGIGYFGYYLNTNAQMEIPLVAVNKDGEAQSNVSTRVRIIKHEYKTVLNKSGSSFRYESIEVENELVDKEIQLNGKGSFPFTPEESGRYEVRIYNPDVTDKYVSRYFYSYGYGRTYLSSFEVNNEGNVDIEFDKKEYEAGEMAKILFTTPFQGKMLVTIEGKEVLDYFYVDTDKRSAEVSLTMMERYLPNVYITATLFKPHESTEFPLTVAHGFKSINVMADDREIPVRISAASESRSRTKQTITVNAYPNSKLTVAVVDEGILQVSGFRTPRPFDYFYQKRALEVSSYDVYPYLFPELSASAAGGDGYDLEKRVNPLKNDRVKLVSFWSGLIEANSLGKATFDIDIPQFSGSLRVMAVGHRGNSFGSDETNILVADPIVMSSTIPRFLSPGDTAVIITTLMNTEEKSTNAQSNIAVSGPFKVIGKSKTSVGIDSKKEGIVKYTVVANNELGSGKITVTCNAHGETFKEETDLTVRPASPLLKESGAGAVAGGSKTSVAMKQGSFMNGTEDYKLIVSKNPMIEFSKDLDYLVRYPYGCTEQTVSAAFPQLYFNDLSIAMYNDDSKAEEVMNNINAAITKLKLRQTYNGGLTMWGSGSENWWVTAYAAHFLIEAKQAGYDYDASLLEYCLGYLEQRLQSKETVSYYYNRGQTKKIAPKEVPYSLYVLALANQSDVSLMNYYKANTSLLSLDGKYLLAAAYALSGDKVRAKELLPNSFEGEVSDRQFGGSFYSPIRDEALALNALLVIDPNNGQIGTMVKHVSDNLKNSNYLNTQDRIYSLLALGKVAKMANNSSVSGTVKANGKNIGTYDKGILTFDTEQLSNKDVEISAVGNGKLYYFWEAEGISKDGSYKEEDSFLKVRKTFYDRYGQKINGTTFQQNDLVVVKISVQKSYNSTIENVVISDILPAGFEIENPRTDEIAGTEWIKNQTYPDHKDIRDDRINLFDDIYASGSNTQDYYYVVRAVSVGTFKMGPVAADAMYNGEYHSYHGAGTITVVK